MIETSALLSLVPSYSHSLNTEGKGFVMVKNETWLPNLPGLSHPSMKAEQQQQACVAVFHQLHCLVCTRTTS